MRKLSDDEKKKRGTFRKDREQKVGTLPEMEIIPDPPDFLSTEAAALYYKTAHFLNEKGLLNEVVAYQVGCYAHEMDVYAKCIKKLEEEGESRAVHDKKGNFLYYQANPLTKVAGAHLRVALAWAKQLLLSPADMPKIPQKPKPPEENPFERLARGDFD